MPNYMSGTLLGTERTMMIFQMNHLDFYRNPF